MIRPLRQYHRRIFAVLGVTLPVGFVVGLAARKPVPDVVSVSIGVTAASPGNPILEWERTDLYVKSPVRVRLLRDSPEVGRFAVRLQAAPSFAKPDLLVYWIAGNPTLAGSLPEDARLLGGFDSPALSVPDEAAQLTGSLVLYSLADQEVVEVSRPVRLGKSNR